MNGRRRFLGACSLAMLAPLLVGGASAPIFFVGGALALSANGIDAVVSAAFKPPPTA